MEGSALGQRNRGLVYALFMANMTTPGLRLLGHTFTRQEHWGWRAWLGLAAVAVLALLLTRSLRPLARLFTTAWRDWSRLSLALYGTLPLVLWILFGEVHAPYPAPFLAVNALCLAAGAVGQMRSKSAVGAMLSLLAGLTVSWLVTTVALAVYWHGKTLVPGLPAGHWSDSLLPMAIAWLVVAAVLLLPAFLDLLRARMQRRRAA